MISVMNSNDFGLDRKADVNGDESQSDVRVSEDNAVVDDSSVETTDCSNDGGAFRDMVGSEEMKVSHGVVVGSSETVTDGDGDVRASLVSVGSEGFRVSTEHENQAQGSDVSVSVSDGDADFVENSRSGEFRVSEIDCRGIDEEMEFRVCEIKNEDATPRGSGNKFSDRNGGIEHLGSRIEGDRVNSGEKGLAEGTHRVSDYKFDVWNGGMEHSASKVGKGRVEVGNSSVSQYDSMLSMFDEFAANGSGKASRAGSHTLLGYGNEIGDMVWGKVKSHPWWPGHIYNEAFATPSVRRTKREGHILVAFFGDSSYGWFDPAELIPFDPNFAEKSHQTNSRTFTKAVEEAVDEASRRCGLGLACRCRNPYNFRPTNVQGYFFVDVVDYEPGGVYSATQIRKSRDSFRPRETLAFIKQLAVVPTVDENPSIDFIKNKATVFAYRKAVFEEFDETYAQAFGVQPVRPSRESRETELQSVKVPSRDTGIGVLSRRCLVSIDWLNRLMMHDLIQNMVREPRLWYYDDILLHVLRNNTGTKAVQGLVLNLPKSDELQLNAKTFTNMERLRLLHLNNVHLSGSLHLTARLVWLSWKGFFSKCLPSTLITDNPVVVDLSYSKLKQVWRGTKLVEVHQSIACLKNLVVLDRKNCQNLEKIPLSIFMLKSLLDFNLSGHSQLEWPAFFQGSPPESNLLQLSCSIKRLDMKDCNITYVPSEIAPLSGRLVIAESLSKRKTSTKLNKAKDQTKKDRYLFKRRDEQDELKKHQIHLGQASSSTQTTYVEGSSALAVGDYVLQKRAPAVSTKPQTPAKQERSVSIGRDGASASSPDITGKEAVTLEEKSAVAKFSITGSQMNANKVEFTDNHARNFPVGQNPDYNSYFFEAKSSLEKGKGIRLEMIDSMGSNVTIGSASVGAPSLQGVFPGLVENVSRTFEPDGEVMMDFKQDPQSASKIKLVEGFQQSSSLPPTVEQLHGREGVQDGGKGAKKVKVLKRPLGELNAEKSASGEKKKKKKKELGTIMSSDRKRMATGNSAALLGKAIGKSDQEVSRPHREDFQAHHQKKVDGADSLLLPDSIGTQRMVGTGNIELELPQLLSDLHSLALNPFHGVERNSPAITKDVFLKFRSLVYQKSLALSTAAETESNEACAGKYPVDIAVSDNCQGERIRDPSALKPRKPPVRPDDPTKGGRKRGPSDRQEEIAAKRLKKLADLKTLASEKKAVQKTPDAPRGDVKETISPAPPKQVKIDSTKKIEPSAKTLEPTMLVMKFPPGTNLPSGSELKARLARFGPLDHSGTRVFWKSSTCRVVFLHKHAAHAAHKYLSGGSPLFGNVSLRCYIREMGASASESEPGKVPKEDTSGETPQLRDSAVEQKLPATPAHQRLQQTSVQQLKSILKKPSGDETGPATSGNNGGGGRGTPRVKFMLGGEESSRGEQLMVSNKNNFINNASFADGGASSSTTHATLDFNSKNFQKVIPPPPLPILPLPNAQFSKSPNNLHYTEVSPRITHNLNTVVAPTAASSATNIDIAHQMLNLLTSCNDVVTNVKDILGYVPYHPL